MTDKKEGEKLPRGRPRKTTTEKPETQEAPESFDFAKLNSASNASDFLSLMGFYNNPIWRNEILKQLSSTPQKYTRDNVLKLIENPVQNEKALKDLAQYLMNTSLHFKRVVHYFARLLDFRYFMRPVGATSADIKSKVFEKSRQKALSWLEKFNIKYEFGNIMETIILEDAGFYYIRENENSITLQRMPTDYCKIVNRTELGYQYAFNMIYFLKPGVTPDMFSPDFQEFYDEFMKGDTKQPYFWMDLPPEKAFVFKWDENFAGIIPVLLGLYLDTIEISEFKQLIKSKTILENWKLLFQKIPQKTEKEAKKNDFLIDADTAGKFQSNIKQALPQGVTVITSPMEVTAVDLNKSENRNNIVGVGEDAFYRSAGISPLLFGTQVSSSAGMQQSIVIDANFVSKMYHQFSRFVNFQLLQTTGKFRFKVVFPDGTKLNQQESFNNALAMANSGFPASLVACHAGLEPNDLEQLLLMEEATGIKEKLVPLLTSHTQSGDTGGRPPTPDSQLQETGVQTRDNQSNENR
jgi:hypothetical protein